jgi:hypothetical protein
LTTIDPGGIACWSVRLYRADPAMVDAITHLVDTDFADMLSDEPGFIDYQTVACDDGRIFSLTMWQDEQGARRSEELAAHFVRDKFAGFDITRTDTLTGDVRVSHALRGA